MHVSEKRMSGNISKKNKGDKNDTCQMMTIMIKITNTAILNTIVYYLYGIIYL